MQALPGQLPLPHDCLWRQGLQRQLLPDLRPPRPAGAVSLGNGFLQPRNLGDGLLVAAPSIHSAATESRTNKLAEVGRRLVSGTPEDQVYKAGSKAICRWWIVPNIIPFRFEIEGELRGSVACRNWRAGACRAWRRARRCRALRRSTRAHGRAASSATASSPALGRRCYPPVAERTSNQQKKSYRALSLPC